MCRVAVDVVVALVGAKDDCPEESVFSLFHPPSLALYDNLHLYSVAGMGDKTLRHDC